MYSNDPSYHIWNLHNQLICQADRLDRLERLISHLQKKLDDTEDVIDQLQTELTELKEQKGVHIGRLEYKFDQLKVETLEGTLNIGLTPAQLKSAIEDIDTEDQSNSFNVNSTSYAVGTTSMQQAIYRYLTEQGPKQLAQLEKKYGHSLDKFHRLIIIEDIKKQLQPRIQHYYKTIMPSKEYGQPMNEYEQQALEQKIINKVVSDIDQALESYVNKLPHQPEEED